MPCAGQEWAMKNFLQFHQHLRIVRGQLYDEEMDLALLIARGEASDTDLVRYAELRRLRRRQE